MKNNNKPGNRPSRARSLIDPPQIIVVALAAFGLVLGDARAQGPGQPFLPAYPIGTDTGLTTDLVVTDLDGDTDLDVVEIKEAALNRVFLNDGNGTLTERAALGSEQADIADGQSAVITDIDNDGALDAVVANWGSPSRVYLGNGDGTFGSGADLAPGSLQAREVASADLDGNGYPDLVVATRNDTNRVYLGDGTGQFIEAAPVSAEMFDTRAIVLADFNGDGRADLLEGNYGAGAKRLRFGNGSGGFGAGVPIGGVTTTYDLAVADLDDDGDLDIVEANFNQPDRYYLNDGLNSFTAFALAGPVDLSQSIDVGDANGDGFLDLLTGNYWGPGVLYVGNGAGGFAAGVTLIPGFDQTIVMRFADLDSDLDVDVVQGIYGSDNRTYENNPVGTFTPAGTFSADNLQTRSAAAADVDDDGDLDILEAKRSGAPNRLYLNDGTGRFSEGLPVTGPYGTNAVIFVDVDNDGDPDIVEGNDGEGNFVYRNDGIGTFDGGAPIGAETDIARSVAAADFNGDGWVDLVIANSSGASPIVAESRVYLNDGAGNFPVATNLGRFQASWSAATGDLDGDGDIDLVIGNYGAPNYLYFNDGAGVFSGGTPLSADSMGTRRIVLADIDADGDLDVVTGNSGAGAPATAHDRIYFNDGSGTFPASLDLTQVPDETFGLAVADVDVDGDLDVVTGLRSGRNQLYLNAGTGAFSAGTPVSTETLDTMFVGLWDVDGSGTVDLFSGNNGAYGRLQLNGNPTTSGLADLTVDEDSPPRTVDLLPAFADLEDAPSALTYEVSGNSNPAAISTAVSGGTLTLSFIPDAFGSVTLRVRATDTDGLFVESAFSVTIRPLADSPRLLAPIPDQSATIGVPFTLNVSTSFADVDGDALTFSAVGLPPTFAIDPVLGVLTGTAVPSDQLSSPFSITVTASSGIAGDTPVADTFELRILDTAAPVITILGENPFLAVLGQAYVDAGATAADGEDGDLTPQIAVVSTVDTNAVGQYTVTYRVTDSSGNTATAIRVVNVINDAPPVLALVGPNPLRMEGGHNYIDPGATATDFLDGDLTSRIGVQYAFNPARVGSYVVTYTVRDSAGLTATATRTVQVVDTTPPAITVRDHATVTLQPGWVYNDAGASARDALDGDITNRIVVDNSVNVRVPGRYTVTYSVRDSAGNLATATRTVVVLEDGGGGAWDPLTLVALLIATVLLRRPRRHE